MSSSCAYRLRVSKSLLHPGGTALRLEPILDESDRCALKPKTDPFGRPYNATRYVLSGGDPTACAWPCDGRCPLDNETQMETAT